LLESCFAILFFVVGFGGLHGVQVLLIDEVEEVSGEVFVDSFNDFGGVIAKQVEEAFLEQTHVFLRVFEHDKHLMQTHSCHSPHFPFFAKELLVNLAKVNATILLDVLEKKKHAWQAVDGLVFEFDVVMHEHVLPEIQELVFVMQMHLFLAKVEHDLPEVFAKNLCDFRRRVAFEVQKCQQLRNEILGDHIVLKMLYQWSNCIDGVTHQLLVLVLHEGKKLRQVNVLVPVRLDEIREILLLEILLHENNPISS
jgi:hypothetical protein